MRRPSSQRGTASVEHLTVLVLVATAGIASVANLGKSAAEAIGGEAASGQASSRAAPMAVSLQAGAVELAGKAARVATDTSFLADEVRAVRRADWARVRHAFGDATNEIQFSLEKEGTSEAILELYRPQHIRESRWALMDEEKRVARWPRFARNYHDLRDWDTFVRRPDTLLTLGKRPGADLNDRWELRTDGYLVTLDNLFGDATYLDDAVGEGGYHWHITFREDPAQADAVADYWRHADEYLQLRGIAEHPENLESWILSPIEDRSFEDARANLRRGRGEDEKMHKVGLRSWLYDEEGRIGLEIRGANEDLRVAARVVDSTVRFLENPARAKIAFNRNVPAYERADIARPVTTARRVPKDLDAWDVDAFERSRIFMPFVLWESRPWLAHLRREIQSARATYAKQLRALADVNDASYHRVSRDLLHEWANALKLHEHY